MDRGPLDAGVQEGKIQGKLVSELLLIGFSLIWRF